MAKQTGSGHERSRRKAEIVIKNNREMREKQKEGRDRENKKEKGKQKKSVEGRQRAYLK